MQYDYDFLIVGSGFGGSVSALRLSEKGYRVLVVEKGRRWSPDQFPRNNWKLRKWMWLPLFRFFGFFKMTIMKHVGILSGVGVGGGSLVYANTLPRPRETFFKSGSWKGLASWKEELEQHYAEAERMLGATANPELFDSDNALKQVAARYQKEKEFEPTRVAVFFGEPEKTVPDPYFKGKGPERAGCTFCGGCMTGCRHDAKNTLDKNYLYFAEKNGVKVLPGKKVIRLEPLGQGDGQQGYRITIRDSMRLIKRKTEITARGVVMAGGVLGTVRLLLNMKVKVLQRLSPMVGKEILTNNESLILIHSRQKEKDFSKGVAIGSIFPADQDTHLEAVRYGSGSGFWKTMGVPLTFGPNMVTRVFKLIGKFFRAPGAWLRIYFSRDFAKESVILLFMQHVNTTLRFRKGAINLRSGVTAGENPSAFMPFARELAEETAGVVDGKPYVMVTEAMTGTPTTAHILGGCVIGNDPSQGVIDLNQKVFGYENLYVCDGSAISSNPGVNPALTITAMTERVMARIPKKE